MRHADGHSGENGESDNAKNFGLHPDNSRVVKFICEIREKRSWSLDNKKGY